MSPRQLYIRQLLLNDFRVRAEASGEGIITDLYNLTITGSFTKEYFERHDKEQPSFSKLLTLGLQCVVMSDQENNKPIISYLLEQGADPTRAYGTLINFKRATWPIFHEHSKYDDTHYESDDCFDDEFVDKANENSNDDADDESLNTDRDNDDCATAYGVEEADGYIPSLNGKTTALHIAALLGNVATINNLLREAREDFRKEMSETQSSPLIIAAWLGNMNIVEALLPYEQQFSFYGFLHTPLQAASARGHLHIVEFLLPIPNADRASGGYPTPLSAASRHGKIEVASLLIDHGANVNPQSIDVLDSPLSNAMINSQYETIRFLLQKGAMFNPSLMLKRYVSIDEEALLIVMEHAKERQEAEWCYNALCIQCRLDRHEDVRNLLSNRTEMSKLNQLDHNRYDSLGDNGPLVIAIKYHHSILVNLLLQTEIPSIFRGNVVLAAVESGNNDIISSTLADPRKSHLVCDKCENGLDAFIAAVRCEKYSTASTIWEYIKDAPYEKSDALEDVKELAQERLKSAKRVYQKARKKYTTCGRLNNALRPY